MKKTFFLFIITLFSISGFSQISDAKEITWYGLDFTHVKLVGSELTDFTNIDDIVDRQFEGWTMLMLNEKEKFNIEKGFRKTVIYDVAKCVELNKTTSKEGLVTLSPGKLSDEDFAYIVSEYKSEKEGIGSLFVIENMVKSNPSVNLYVVFFEINTGNVLYKKFIQAEVTGGFGFRNWWASGLYSTIKEIQKGFPKWDLK